MARTSFALVYGTAAPAGRLRTAMTVFAGRLSESGARTVEIDLSVTPMPFADGTPLEKLPPEAAAVLQAVSDCNALVLFAPIYRAAVPGALKNLLDLLPLEALGDKPVALVAMGASPHHYLGGRASLAPVLDWFGAISCCDLYLTGRSFEDGVPNAEATSEISACAASLLDITVRTAGLKIRPRPLAARMG